MANRALLIINGKQFSGWQSVSVNKTLSAISGTFSVSLADPLSMVGWNIRPFNDCKILLNDISIISGFVDRINLSIDSNSHTVSISGRDRTGDIVDCSAVGKSGRVEWFNKRAENIIKELLEPYKINLIIEKQSTGTIAHFKLESGESVFEAIDRLCKAESLLPVSTESGNLKLTEIGKTRCYDKLIYGENVLNAQGTIDYTDRFSDYQLKATEAKTAGGWGGATQNIAKTGTANDKGVLRYRKKIIVADKSFTSASCKKRAIWEATIRAGKSEKLTVTVRGWTQSNNEPWRVNTLALVRIPQVMFETELLIDSVDFSQSNSGTLTTLSLVHKDTYNSETTVILAKEKSAVKWEIF